MEFRFEQLDEQIQESLKKMGFKKPTPIQSKAIPLALKGFDVVGQAQTGTGKTAAFGIPIVSKIEPKDRKVRALILAPTRELAIQVANEISLIGKKKGVFAFPVYGGTPIGKQISVLKRKKNQIIVGTVGRVKDLINRGILNLSGIRYVVLDEADQMLDMGFIEDVKDILSKTPNDRQTMLFSATIPYEIRKLINRYLKPDYKFVKVVTKSMAPKIEQKLFLVRNEEKLKALEKILRNNAEKLSIVFVKTKKDAAHIGNELKNLGFSADAIHGDLSQRQRERVMKAFRMGKIRILVATDVASRGIDIRNVELVVNFELPENPESYVHRIGRTGRAGRRGIAISLVSENEKNRIYRIRKLKNVNLEKFTFFRKSKSKIPHSLISNP